MNHFCSFALALLALALPASAGSAHSFDSGGLHPVVNGEIVVPGARTVPNNVTLKLRVTSLFEVGAETLDAGPSSFQALMFPRADVFGGFDVHMTLPAFFVGETFAGADGIVDYDGAGGSTWVSSTLGAEVVLTLTDPLLCAQYVGPEVSIPLAFAGGYSSTWTGGNGSSFVTSAYGWSGTLTYN